MNELLRIVYVILTMWFTNSEPMAVPIPCAKGVERNTAKCSHAGYVIPGFPTRETWTRQPDTPLVFTGKAVPYSREMMWATARVRGFDYEYLVQFDCLVSGFFINDVGRVAWMLHDGDVYQCLVVDNARSRDIYNPVINSRESVEVSYNFYHDVLGGKLDDRHPIVTMAYQIEEPTPREWLSAERLDEWLFNNWETSYKEPKGWIQIKPDQQAWYKIDGWGELWTRVEGCLYCQDEFIYTFNGEMNAYEVVYGDSLDLISKKMYGYSHPRFWDAIFEANRDIMDNPYYIETGMILMIPEWGLMPIEQ